MGGGAALREAVADLLKGRGQTVSFAESCTAGMISSQFGDIPGVSRVLKGAVVCYVNEIKTSVLGVPHGILERFGAVSGECAAYMAAGCRRLMHTDYAVAVSGVAGPDPDSMGKPVGLVYLAVADGSGYAVKRMRVLGSRTAIRSAAALMAFVLLRGRLFSQLNYIETDCDVMV
jgi:nicotinamide-nucleotide amidase